MSVREEFVANFREIHPKFTRFYTKILDKSSLTLPQYALLNQLDHSGATSMTEISDRLQITKPAVTNLVDRLEEKKFLRRSPHPKDRRVILIEMVAKGKKALTEIQTSSLAILLKAYDSFNSLEHQTISRFYATLSRTMDEFLMRCKNEK